MHRQELRPKRSLQFPSKSMLIMNRITSISTFKDLEFHCSFLRFPSFFFSRQKRVFGTIRSTNIHVKTATENPITKQPKSITRRGNPSINVTTDQVAKKPERFKKKSTEAREKVRPSLLEPRTPVASHSMIENKVAAGTPYHSAKYCSKCRFDKLETASCWLGQIKLAESVGKHFVPIALIRLPSIPMLAESVGKHLVSVAFFRLAFDSNVGSYPPPPPSFSSSNFINFYCLA